MAPRGLVVLFLVLAALPFSQAVAVYCEGLTGVVGCIECSKPAGGKRGEEPPLLHGTSAPCLHFLALAISLVLCTCLLDRLKPC